MGLCPLAFPKKFLTIFLAGSIVGATQKGKLNNAQAKAMKERVRRLIAHRESGSVKTDSKDPAEHGSGAAYPTAVAHRV